MVTMKTIASFLTGSREGTLHEGAPFHSQRMEASDTVSDQTAGGTFRIHLVQRVSDITG